MKKIECYQSSDEEFTGTKAEVLEYELNQAKRTAVERFCNQYLNSSDNTRSDVYDVLNSNLESLMELITNAQKAVKAEAAKVE